MFHMVASVLLGCCYVGYMCSTRKCSFTNYVVSVIFQVVVSVLLGGRHGIPCGC